MADPVKNQALLNKIAKRVIALREAKGLTQEDVYNDTGINIGRIEKAKRNMSVSTLDALCKYFKLSLKEFLEDM